MSSEAAGAIVLLGIYGLMLLGAIRLFGLRRVLAFFLVIVLLAIGTAFKSLEVMAGAGRR